MSGIILAFFAAAILLSYGAFHTWLIPVRLVSNEYERRKLTFYGLKLAVFSVISFFLAVLLFLTIY